MDCSTTLKELRMWMGSDSASICGLEGNVGVTDFFTWESQIAG